MTLKVAAALIATALCGTQTAHATAQTPNGSFGFVPLGNTIATTSSGWEIGPNTETITIPSLELVNTSTNGTVYLGNPDNIDVPITSYATLSYSTISVPTLNVTTSLTTPLTVKVTNSASDALDFSFSSIFATSSGNGSLDLYWLGDLTSDAADAFAPGTASLSAAFTAGNRSASNNVSFSLAIPPAPDPFSLPEPATLAVLSSGVIGLSFVRQRKV